MPANQAKFAPILENHAAALLKEGRSEEAMRMATTSLSTARQAVEEDTKHIPMLVQALEALGDVHRELGETDRAEKRYREAIDLISKNEVPLALRARVRSRLATLLDFSQRESESVPFYEQAIDDYEALTPPDEDVAAQLRNNLAMIFKGTGKFALSEQHYLRGLEILEQKHGHESEFTATLFNNLGSLYYTAGFPEQGREMLEEALEIRTRLLGPDHPDVAQTHSNLASTCHHLGDNDAALEHYELGLAVLEKHIKDEAASYEAVGLDYLSLLDSIKEDKRSAAFKKRMQRVLGTV